MNMVSLVIELTHVRYATEMKSIEVNSSLTSTFFGPYSPRLSVLSKISELSKHENGWNYNHKYVERHLYDSDETSLDIENFNFSRKNIPIAGDFPNGDNHW